MWECAAPAFCVRFMASDLFFRTSRAVGTGRDLAGELAADAAGVVRADELPAAALPLPAGEDLRAQGVRDPARLDSYLVCGRMRGGSLTTEFALEHPFSHGWHFVRAGGLMSGRASD